MTDQSPEIAFILGTRPEIIKLAPVVRACDRHNVRHLLLHTGQHYSEELNGTFFEQLALPQPDYNLDTGSGLHGEKTAEMIAGIESILLDESPDIALVQGDTNSVLAGAIATSKLKVELGHVEAGLRSFDRDMPEETNRVLADHSSDYLFAPTDGSAELLQKEGVSNDRIFVTGNTIVDSVQEHTQLAARKSTALSEFDLEAGEFALMTAHRAENVDNADRFEFILDGIARFASASGLEVIYPIHPRAEEQVEAFELTVSESIRTVPPLNFLDFLQLEMNAAVVFTDSGGVQEETCILQTPCVTVRDCTERPETLDVGSNTLAGTTPDSIVASGKTMLDRSTSWENPFGDGRAANRIIEILEDKPVKNDSPLERSKVWVDTNG